MTLITFPVLELCCLIVVKALLYFLPYDDGEDGTTTTPEVRYLSKYNPHALPVRYYSSRCMYSCYYLLICRQQVLPPAAAYLVT